MRRAIEAAGSGRYSTKLVSLRGLSVRASGSTYPPCRPIDELER
jgi:hypothetical protein